MLNDAEKKMTKKIPLKRHSLNDKTHEAESWINRQHQSLKSNIKSNIQMLHFHTQFHTQYVVL